MNEEAVMIIHDYINKNLFAPAGDWPEYQFEKRSYEIWAANEILNRIIETPELDPLLAILYFRYQMTTLAGIREDSDAEFIFITARDIADKIMLLF